MAGQNDAIGLGGRAATLAWSRRGQVFSPSAWPRVATQKPAIAGHGNWLPWLEHEFGWDPSTADNFVHVFEASLKFGNFPNLNLPANGLYLLAAPSTSDEGTGK